MIQSVSYPNITFNDTFIKYIVIDTLFLESGAVRRVFLELIHPVRVSNNFMLLDTTQLQRALPLPPLAAGVDPRSWDLEDIDRRKYFRADVSGSRYLELRMNERDEHIFSTYHDGLV